MNKLVKALKAFPIGNFVLLATYILIGLVDGNPEYANEISKLLEVRYLLAQTIFSGISYVVIYYAILEFRDFSSKENQDKVTIRETIRFLAGFAAKCAVLIAIALGLSNLIGKMDSLKGYTGDIFMGITTMVIVVILVAYVAHDVIENKKINKALEERKQEE